MVNELTGVKVTYGYDEFSNLVWSNQGGQFDFLHRSVDDVGNLYETNEKTDRSMVPEADYLKRKRQHSLMMMKVILFRRLRIMAIRGSTNTMAVG
ncbi:hypothetical protein ACQKOF_24965 [Lysinibacillus sp. NPDC093190]|uniref:hypothetical protein n=1 Tax=Lysinibacillus sp. NPDC093190 TaxID=3390575 RepID=UPI003D00CFFC